LTWWFPKLKLVGLRLTTGADAVVPTKTLTDRVPCEVWMIRTSAVVSAETGATNPPHITHTASTAPLSARRSINCCQNWVSFMSYSFRRCRYPCTSIKAQPAERSGLASTKKRTTYTINMRRYALRGFQIHIKEGA
jgi:hypothetical protein